MSARPPSSRMRRIGEQLRRDLTDLIREEVDHPASAMVSLTAVEVTRDLAYAKVYITLLGEVEQRSAVLKALNGTAGLMRRELGRSLHLRTIPRLQFIYDESIERGAELSSLIDQVIHDDAVRHRDDDEASS